MPALLDPTHAFSSEQQQDSKATGSVSTLWLGYDLSHLEAALAGAADASGAALRQACALPALACASAWLKAAALPDACAWEYASAEQAHNTNRKRQPNMTLRLCTVLYFTWHLGKTYVVLGVLGNTPHMMHMACPAQLRCCEQAVCHPVMPGRQLPASIHL